MYSLLVAAPNTINLTENLGHYGNLVNLRPSLLLSSAMNILFAVAGIAAFFYLLWGGIQYINAGGDKEGTDKARKKLTAALVGLAIVFSVYALLSIISTLFGVELLTLPIKPLINSGQTINCTDPRQPNCYK